MTEEAVYVCKFCGAEAEAERRERIRRANEGRPVAVWCCSSCHSWQDRQECPTCGQVVPRWSGAA